MPKSNNPSSGRCSQQVKLLGTPWIIKGRLDLANCSSYYRNILHCKDQVFKIPELSNTYSGNIIFATIIFAISSTQFGFGVLVVFVEVILNHVGASCFYQYIEIGLIRSCTSTLTLPLCAKKIVKQIGNFIFMGLGKNILSV